MDIPKVGEIWAASNDIPWFITIVDNVNGIYCYPLADPSKECWRSCKYFLQLFRKIQ